MADYAWPARKKIIVSCSFKGKEDDGRISSQNSFALDNVNIYQFNTYRKNRRVSSIVSRMGQTYRIVRDIASGEEGGEVDVVVIQSHSVIMSLSFGEYEVVIRSI